jgi:hypothetical protein
MTADENKVLEFSNRIDPDLPRTALFLLANALAVFFIVTLGRKATIVGMIFSGKPMTALTLATRLWNLTAKTWRFTQQETGQGIGKLGLSQSGATAQQQRVRESCQRIEAVAKESIPLL